MINALVENLLEIDEGVLSASLINFKGQIVASKSKYHINNGFTSGNGYGDANCAVWVRAAYAMVEQFAKSFGNVHTFVTCHENLKVIVIPYTCMNSLIVLVTLGSASVEHLTPKVGALLPDIAVGNKLGEYKTNLKDKSTTN
jgi:hypothetical protein